MDGGPALHAIDNPVSGPLRIISHEPVVDQCFNGIQVGMLFTEFVGINLFRLAVLRNSMTDSIQ